MVRVQARMLPVEQIFLMSSESQRIVAAHQFVVGDDVSRPYATMPRRNRDRQRETTNEVTMVRTLSPMGLLVGCLVLAACGRQQNADAGSETTALARNCSPGLQGDLKTFRLSHVRAKAIGVDPAGDWHKHPSAAVAIQPMCESHEKDASALRRGQFVARLMLLDTQRPYSKLRTDIVYWWVFERNGALVSQFFSMSQTDEDSAIVEFPFTQCAGTEPKTEIAGWHGGACLQMDSLMADGRPPPGDNPWFGCKLGCCYSVTQ